MPIYEYHCRQCDNKFERLVSMSTQDIDIQCPACQQKDVEKVLSVFAAKTAHAPTAPANTGCTTCSTSFRGGWGIWTGNGPFPKQSKRTEILSV